LRQQRRSLCSRLRRRSRQERSRRKRSLMSLSDNLRGAGTARRFTPTTKIMRRRAHGTLAQENSILATRITSIVCFTSAAAQSRSVGAGVACGVWWTGLCVQALRVCVLGRESTLRLHVSSAAVHIAHVHLSGFVQAEESSLSLSLSHSPRPRPPPPRPLLSLRVLRFSVFQSSNVSSSTANPVYQTLSLSLSARNRPV